MFECVYRKTNAPALGKPVEGDVTADDDFFHTRICKKR